MLFAVKLEKNSQDEIMLVCSVCISVFVLRKHFNSSSILFVSYLF